MGCSCGCKAGALLAEVASMSLAIATEPWDPGHTLRDPPPPPPELNIDIDQNQSGWT